MKLAVMLLLALAASARAELAQFDAGPNKPDATFSDDGYHFAYFESDGREDRWMVDGSPRVRLPAGSLTAGTGTLSADGKVLLHLVNVFDSAGTPLGVAPAINGKRLGKAVYPEIQGLSVSPRGANVAFAAHFPNGWAVVSAQGVGPAFADPPVLLGLTERGVLYLGSSGGATWLYRDHKAVGRADYSEASASDDLRRSGGLIKTDDGVFVEIDGARTGPYGSATVPVFSPNGRHAAFLAETLPSAGVGYDALYVDGRSAPLHDCKGCGLEVDDAGRAFEDQLLIALDDRSEMHRFFLDGKELGRPPHVGLSAGGRHFVYPQLTGGGGNIGLDGKVTERGAPVPVPSSTVPIAFDGQDEYHYWTIWGQGLRLVCGAVDGSNPNATRCAELGRALYKPVPKDE